MKKNYTNMMFYSSLTWSLTMSISTNSMMILWMMIEMSTMSFIPMMVKKSMINSESIMKFFIIQSMSSSMMLMLIMTMFLINYINEMLMMTLIMKMGGVPFHSWILSMMEGLDYMNIWILITIMKIPTMMMLSNLELKMNTMVLLSMTIPTIMMINQNILKKMITYSSIFNMSMMLYMSFNNKMWIQFIIIYSMIMYFNMNEFHKNKLLHLNQMLINNKEKMTKMNMWISMMSMAGMPPMLGFINKLMFINTSMKNKEMFMLTMMIASSSMIFFMYMKFMFSCMMFEITLNKTKKSIMNFNSYMMLIINTFMMPMFLMIKMFN